jgi:hypothetical protein
MLLVTTLANFDFLNLTLQITVIDVQHGGLNCFNLSLPLNK